MRRQWWVLSAAAALASVVAPDAAAQSFPPPLTPTEVDEVRTALARMKAAERGPYARILWYCADGTQQPAQGAGCRERGGGVQHAAHSPEADRLADLGFRVGTILQATTREDFVDGARSGYRLRELVMERYLQSVDDGWVMRRARYYRGALQIEDEERVGRELLSHTFGDAAWLRTHYLLATRLAAALPHLGLADNRSMDRIRATALEISNEDPDFLRIRVKIHSLPSPEDIGAVEGYLARESHAPTVRARLVQLRDDLRAQYDPERALASLAVYRGRVGAELGAGIDRLRSALDAGDAARSFREISDLAPRVRERATAGVGGETALDMIDLGLALQERAFVLAQELDRTAPARTRGEALRRVGRYVDLSYAAGYLSAREREALRREIGAVVARPQMAALEYKTSLGYVGRSLDWARGTVRGTFAPVVDRYTTVEPRAAGLTDDLLRGSVILPLSRVLDRLHSDADQLLGAAHSVFGTSRPSGFRGLNPGVAMRPLRLLEPGHHDEVDAGTIYVLAETPPELKPVAGVLTMAEGNLLSHVQLLARNLGIPNATVDPAMLPVFQAVEGREVFYAVSPLGRVILARPDQLGPEERALVQASEPTRAGRYRLDTTRLRLDARRPIPLSELRAPDSGVLVGPKAANLGQLAADFPGRVSSAVALPFGMFYRHADRPYGGSSSTVLGELRAAYATAASMRTDGRPEAEIDAYMFERLAWVREAIQSLEWIPESRELVVAAVTQMLEGDLARGVFIRSDTNVEDLPEFSGAGLNLTIANQTSIDGILGSIPRVWTSPFSERAYLWRKQILEEQGAVYPSILIQETVKSDKSGVLITSGLQEGGPRDLTVVAAEGVGGAVDGEDAETLLLGADGGVRLLSQAKAPSRREVVPGGTRWIAAVRPETLLRPEELAQLRAVVASWRARKAGTPEAVTTWDIEYGFVDGRLWLFQIRPFVRFRDSDVYGRLGELDAGALANAGRSVLLSGALGAG